MAGKTLDWFLETIWYLALKQITINACSRILKCLHPADFTLPHYFFFFLFYYYTPGRTVCHEIALNGFTGHILIRCKAYIFLSDYVPESRKHLFQSNTIGGFCPLSFRKQKNIILLWSLVLHGYFPLFFFIPKHHPASRQKLKISCLVCLSYFFWQTLGQHRHIYMCTMTVSWAPRTCLRQQNKDKPVLSNGIENLPQKDLRERWKDHSRRRSLRRS